MSRKLFAAAAAFAVLLSAANAYQGGGDALLDKKDKLTDKDPGYKPDPSMLTNELDKIVAKAVDGNAHKVFTVKLAKGDKVVIELKSKDFDAVVAVENAARKVVAINDDDPAGKGTLDSRLEWTVPEAGDFRIVATCLDKQFGDFHLTVTKAK